MSEEMWQFELRPFAANDVRQILTWRYKPPYDIYNMSRGTADPLELSESLDYFLQSRYHFQAVLRQPAAELVAFCSFGPDGQVAGGDYSIKAIDIGLGIHPDLTGCGLGSMFVGVAIDVARKTFAPPRLRVTIAAFNRRAQKVWQQHNFVPLQRFRANFGRRPFIIYVRNVR